MDGVVKRSLWTLTIALGLVSGAAPTVAAPTTSKVLGQLPSRDAPIRPTRRAKPPSAEIRHLEAFLERGRGLSEGDKEAREASLRWLRLAHMAWEDIQDPVDRIRTMPMAAEALFLQGEVLRDRFDEALFDNMDHLPEQVDAKMAALVDAELLYRATMALHVNPWEARAALHIGQMYQTFAQRFATVPFPDNIPAQYHQRLRTELLEFAKPMRHRAIDSLNRALDLALQHDNADLAAEARERLLALERY